MGFEHNNQNLDDLNSQALDDQNTASSICEISSNVDQNNILEDRNHEDLNDGQTNVEKEPTENFNTSAIPETDEPLQELTTKSPTKKTTQIYNKSKYNSKDSFIPSYLDKTISTNKYGVKEVVPNLNRRDSTQRLFNILLSSSSSKKRKNEDSCINFSTPN